MAEKISTLILTVDLDCHFCYKKIKKVLCRLQEKEDVKAIFYDEKNKTVTIAGAFNPHKVAKWLCCKACKIIKEYEIKDEKPKGDNKSKDDKPAKNEKPKDEKDKKDEKSKKDDKPNKDDKPKNDKTKGDKSKNDKLKDDKAIVKFKLDENPKDEKTKNGKPKDDKPKIGEPEGKPKLVPQKALMELPRADQIMVGGYPQMQMPLPYQNGWPAGPASMPGPAGPGGCCFRPIYEGVYGGGCRCCTCGRSYGFMAGAPMGYYGGGIPYGEYKGCQFFYEEDPSVATCSLM